MANEDLIEGAEIAGVAAIVDYLENGAKTIL
jgi:hypothetical protein